MKNQYCGDVGDLSKFALLRSLQSAFPQERIGIIWYLTRDDEHTRVAKDGRFVIYPKLETCDPELYKALQSMVIEGQRNVSEFRKRGLTLRMAEYDQPLDVARPPSKSWQQAREEWFQGALRATANCSVVFLDPDNGIAPDQVRLTQARCDKFALPSELSALRSRGQTVICYQHATRVPFDQYLVRRTSEFPGSFAIRWHRIQPRAYLVWPSGEQDLRSWAGTLVEDQWKPHFTLVPVRLS